MNEFTYSTSSQTSTVDPADPLGVRKQEGGVGGIFIIAALIAGSLVGGFTNADSNDRRNAAG